jgi:MFS family permease
MRSLAHRAPGRPLPPGLLRFLWVRLAGTTAAQMLLVALAWQMYELTASAWDLGLVGLVQFLPALLLTIPAGQIVDRVDRRLVLAGALVLQALVAGVLGWASATGGVSRELILGFCVVIGVARALQMPSQQALLPSLVPSEALPRALAVSSSVLQVAVIGGPALGGFVYAAGAFAVYGVAFALLALSPPIASGIRVPRAARDRAPVTLASVFAGFGFIRRQRIVLGAMSLDLFAVLLGGATALLPMFAKDVLDTGAWGLGILRAAPAAGAFAMGVALARWPLRHRVGRWMFAAVAVYGV